MTERAERIRCEVASWEGVEVAPQCFGGIEFKLGRRELGHLCGDRLGDINHERASAKARA